MPTEPILDHVIVDTKLGRIDRMKKSLHKHKPSLILGAALAASLTMNVLLVRRPEHVCAYDLNSDDVAYLNRLLEEDQKN